MLKKIQEKLGPGLLCAAAAVGVSHLVSSTTAGATYGMIMVLYAIVVCLVKYPTFLFGATYTAATGETLVDGYGRLGRWVVAPLFALLNHIVMFGKNVSEADRPGIFIKTWSYGTIAILSLVTVIFIYLTYLT